MRHSKLVSDRKTNTVFVQPSKKEIKEIFVNNNLADNFLTSNIPRNKTITNNSSNLMVGVNLSNTIPVSSNMPKHITIVDHNRTIDTYHSNYTPAKSIILSKAY